LGQTDGQKDRRSEGSTNAQRTDERTECNVSNS